MLPAGGITPRMVGLVVSSGPPDGASFKAQENNIEIDIEIISMALKLLTARLASSANLHYQDRVPTLFSSFPSLCQADSGRHKYRPDDRII